jgi:DNA polymerase III alpha subunit
MADGFVDLHCHSTASDGTLAPRDVVRLAKESNLSALSLTDHDTIAGVAEASEEAKQLGVDFLPGIEISAEYPNPCTSWAMAWIRQTRRSRASPKRSSLAATTAIPGSSPSSTRWA